MARSAKVDEFSRNFDEEFCLIACMASTIGRNSLIGKGKAKRKKGGNKNLDMPKVKCFICHKQEHFAS